ncbi:MAG: hypothetical protein CMI22_06335 [Opitutae bacterium]|nr:hypothetical protein [Opitutae bacterium]|tara:strand:+ start:231 stop:686 length:456 start_codon:yes stop_codon:yes gene_type:complete
MISKNIRYLFCSIILILFFVSCSQIEYARSGNNQALVSEQNGNVQKSEPLEKPTYKVVFRKSNLEALAIGRNRIEIQELMGEPEGKSLDGGNGYLWDYRRPVLDENTGEIYGWSLISFKFLRGLCAYVNIRLEQPPPEILQQQNSNGFLNF